jgi:hypothetical protein
MTSTSTVLAPSSAAAGAAGAAGTGCCEPGGAAPLAAASPMAKSAATSTVAAYAGRTGRRAGGPRLSFPMDPSLAACSQVINRRRTGEWPRDSRTTRCARRRKACSVRLIDSPPLCCATSPPCTRTIWAAIISSTPPSSTATHTQVQTQGRCLSVQLWVSVPISQSGEELPSTREICGPPPPPRHVHGVPSAHTRQIFKQAFGEAQPEALARCLLCDERKLRG